MNPAIVCSLTAELSRDRSTAWRYLLDGWGVQRRRLPDRIELTFRAEPGVIERVRELADLERECCPWFSSAVSTRDVEVLEMFASEDGLNVLAATFEVG